MRNDVLIIVPAYNEQESIYKTILSIQQLKGYDYIVINDGSNDRTGEILDQYHFNHIDLSANLGIGGAMQTGYKYAEKKGYSYAIQFDADGQHNAEDLDKLVEEIKRSSADMVIGSRFVEQSHYKGSFMRRIGIYYFYFLLFVLTKIRVTDPTSGYRIVNKKVIHEFTKYYPVDYPEVEVIVHLSKLHFRIKETKVEMQHRQGGVSSITPFKSIYYMIKVTLFSFIRVIF